MKKGFVVLFCWIISTTWLAAAWSVEPERQIFAHYMGCFPAGYGAIEVHRKEQSQAMKHDSNHFVETVGGRIVNWPLTPQEKGLDPDKASELEIQRAIQAGIDGFAVDAWAGGDNAKTVFDRLIRAAQRLNVPFSMTVCLDASCHKPDKEHPGDYTRPYTETIQWLLDRYGNNPHLARRNGKLLIFGYHSRDIYRTPEMKNMPETPQKWDLVTNAFQQIEKNVGQDIYFHFCFDSFFYDVPKQLIGEQTTAEALKYVTQHFDAVGGFLGNSWSRDPQLQKIIREGTAEWSEPMIFQYVNKQYMFLTGNGLDRLRLCWESAIKNRSTLIQFVTWNDYGEDTILAPGYSTGYTICDVNRYYVDLWKNGKNVPEEESLHVVYRRSPTGADPYPFQKGGMSGTLPESPGVLEVISILREPAIIEVPEYQLRYEAPSGLSYRQVPLRPGPISATARRAGKEILVVKAPEIVTDKPFRFDPSMVCFSSDFDQKWSADFPGTEPLHYSENGDIDQDGLPNWFEMYWFGKFPDMKTATVAEPDSDPDGDGQTNLQEYRNRTNPLVAEKPYASDEVWNFDDINRKGVSFNPDRDVHGHNVWWYLYKVGARCQTPHDGHYMPCPSMGANVAYAGKMAHLSPSRDKTYQNVHGWISRYQDEDKNWILRFFPRVNVIMVLGWKSPIDGSVSVRADIMPVKGNDGITLEIARETDSLFEKTFQPGVGGPVALDNISAKKGNFLYFIADQKPGYDTSDLRFKSLEIKRVPQ